MSMITRVDLEFDLADRIRRALRVSGLGVGELASTLEVNRNTIGNWINGRITPGTQSLYAIAALTGVPFEWLKTGKAPSEDEADSEFEAIVRPKGFEPPTFCSVASMGSENALATALVMVAILRHVAAVRRARTPQIGDAFSGRVVNVDVELETKG